MRRAAPAGALALAILVACGSEAKSGRDGATGLTPEARISFVNPWFHLSKGNTEIVGIAIDGVRAGHCGKSDRDHDKVCIDKQVLAPGWHVVSIDFTYRSDQTLNIAQDYFHGEDRVLASAGEDIVYDLAKSDGTEDQRRYLSRTSTANGLSSCETLLYSLAGAPACTAGELRALTPRVADAAKRCGGISTSEEQRAAGVLAFAEQNLFHIEAERCFVPKQKKQLPRILLSSDSSDRYWPRGTLKKGSWGWARDVLPPTPDLRARARESSAATRLATMRDALPRAIERLDAIEDFTIAYAAGAKPQAAIDKALRGPFDTDPRTVAGHRLNLLFLARDLVRSDTPPALYYDERLAAFIAHGLAESKLSCGQEDETARALGYLFSDKKISTAEWEAVKKVVERTPADKNVSETCRDAATDMASDVPQIDRLRWLATWDCSSSRHPRLRAEAVRFLLSSRTTQVPAETRKKVRDELVACVGVDD